MKKVIPEERLCSKLEIVVTKKDYELVIQKARSLRLPISAFCRYILFQNLNLKIETK